MGGIVDANRIRDNILTVDFILIRLNVCYKSTRCVGVEV